MFSLVTAPSWQTLMTGAEDYSQGFFNEFMPFLWIIVGIALGVAVIILFKRAILAAINWVTNKMTGNNDNILPHEEYSLEAFTIHQRR